MNNFIFFKFKPDELVLALSKEQTEIKSCVEHQAVIYSGAPLHVRMVLSTSVGPALYG